MAVFFYLGLGVFSFVAWNIVALYRNYRLAKSIGLPIVIVPWSTFNPVGIVLYQLLPSAFWRLRRVSWLLGEWTQCCYFSWQWKDNGELFRRLGQPAFVKCMPSFNEVHVADAAAADYILVRRKEFLKPQLAYNVLNVFGRNLDTVDGETWQRHRRLTVPSLSERINGTVWNEAARQCDEMLAEWEQAGISGTRATTSDTATLALNVWMRAGFGIQHSFCEKVVEDHEAEGMTYKDALFEVISDFVYIIVLPANWLGWRFAPKKLQRVGEACFQFKQNVKKMLDEAKQAAEHKGHSQGNLLRALVQASEDAWGQDRKSGIGLEDDELYGNIWVFSFAGFETTANALATVVAYLAAFPKWQDWLIAEIDTVLVKGTGSIEGQYEDLFPQMKRIRAAMYETLRVHGSVLQLPKITGPQVQTLDIAGKPHTLPPETHVSVDIHSIHCDQDIWGSDALEWRPNRWIHTNGDGHEELIQPRAGTFLPWAEGVRVCPGKKFAQVEVTAVMITLLRKHKVSVVPVHGQSAAKAQAATLAMIQDSHISRVTLQMRRPGAVSLAWKERSST